MNIAVECAFGHHKLPHTLLLNTEGDVALLIMPCPTCSQQMKKEAETKGYVRGLNASVEEILKAVKAHYGDTR